MPPEETQTPEETQIPETIGQVETSNDLAKIEADFAKLKNEIDSLSVTDKAKRCKEIKNAIKEARNAEWNLSDTTIQNRLTQLEDELTQLETSNQPENTFVWNTWWEQVEDNSNSSRRYRTQAEENEAIEEEVQITPVEWWIISGVGSWIGSIEMINSLLTRSWLEKIDFSKEFNAEKIEDLLNRMADHLEKERNVRIGHHDWFKDNAYDRSIKAYREAADALKDEAWKQAIKKYLELEKKLQGRISNTFLKNIAKIDTREMANIVRWLNSASESEIQALAKCQTEDKIIKFFADRNIRISREYASQLKLASTVDEVKLMIWVSRHWSRLSRIARWIKWMSWFSFACVWLDVFLLMEWLNESEMISKYNKMRWEYRKQRAWVETWIWVWALALEWAAIIVYCAACWSSVWVFWTVAWLAIWTVSYIAYELYGARQDKKDFYAQNRYDFVNQKRTKIKQSIVQLFQSDNLNLDASLKKKIKKDREEIWIKDELKTMEDARESLIFQEETASWEFQLLEMFYSMGDSNENNFKKKLTAEQKEEFENQKKKMEGLIKMRKEYIKQYIDRNKRYSVLCDAIGRNTWMACVEQILADSKVYADIKGIQEQNEKEWYDYVQHYKNFANDFDIKWYKKEYKKMLLKEYKKEFEKFEKLHKDNPGLFNLICDGFMSSSYYINNIDFSPRDEAMKEIIKEFNEWVQVKWSNITKASECHLRGLMITEWLTRVMIMQRRLYFICMRLKI